MNYQDVAGNSYFSIFTLTDLNSDKKFLVSTLSCNLINMSDNYSC